MSKRLVAGTDAILLEPSGSLSTSSGRIVGTTRITAAYTAGETDYMIFADTDGGAFTLTLPAGVEGRYYRIANVGSSGNDLTIAPDGAELLLGANANYTLSDGEVLIIVYNATEGWF